MSNSSIGRPKKQGLPLQLKQSLFGISIECPFDGSNPDGCPLCAIRKLSLKERFEWVSRLTIEEATAIWAKHEKCLVTKEGVHSLRIVPVKIPDRSSQSSQSCGD
jgi:hypothetical protein